MYFEKYQQEGQQILQTLAKELKCPNNVDRAARTLKAVLHALRNRLGFKQALVLLDTLPMSLKVVFVDHWPVLRHQAKPVEDLDDLINEVRKLDGKSSIQDFTTKEEAQQAIYAVFRIMGRNMNEKQVMNMVGVLP